MTLGETAVWLMRIAGSTICMLGGVRLASTALRAKRFDLVGAAAIAIGFAVLACSIWIAGGEVSLRTLGPAVRGAFKALFGQFI